MRIPTPLYLFTSRSWLLGDAPTHNKKWFPTTPSPRSSPASPLLQSQSQTCDLTHMRVIRSPTFLSRKFGSNAIKDRSTGHPASSQHITRRCGRGWKGICTNCIAHRGSPIDIEPGLGACRIGLAPDVLPIPPSVDTQTDFELHGFPSCHRLFEACLSWEMNG